MAVHTLDRVGLLNRFQRHKIADRYHLPIVRAHAQVVERAHAAFALWVTDANIDLVLRIVRTIFSEQDAIGDELDCRADCLRADAETVGDFPVDLDIPLDAGQGPGVLDVAQFRRRIHRTSDCVGDRDQLWKIVRRDIDHHVLADRRAILRFTHLHMHTGEIFSLPGDVVHNQVGLAAFAVVLQLDRDTSDIVDGPAAFAIAGLHLPTADRKDRFYSLVRRDDPLDAHDQIALFVGREISARGDEN